MRTGHLRFPRIAAIVAVVVVTGPVLATQPVFGAGPAGAPAPVAPMPTVQAAQAQVLATQDLIDAASATLAQVRNELFIATDPATITALDIQESRLQVRKTALIARLAVQQRRLNQLIAAQALASQQAGAASLGLNTSTPPVLGAIAGANLPAPGPTVATIDGFLQSQLSPLTGLGAVFVADAESVGVDPRLLVAITGAETSFGTYGPAQAIRNPFGLGPNLRFPNWSAAIQAAANTLGGNLYRGAGLVTIAEIQSRWAPRGVANDPMNLNNNWQANVDRYYADLGGNPNGAVIISGASQLVSLSPTTPAPGTEGPAAAQTALGLLGVPNPADSPDGLNAVELVQTVYQDQGVSLPGSLTGLATAGTAQAPQGLRAGDAVFFADASGTIDHVGVYLGGGEFIHAPGPEQRVRIASLYDNPWRTSYALARRY
jgi:cell wall-associated NlpC family hydrolase